MNKQLGNWRRFAAALGGLLADAYLTGDAQQLANHPPDTYRSHLAHTANWIR